MNSLSLDLGTQDDLTLEQKDLLSIVLDSAGGAMDDAKMDLDLIGDESVEEADPTAVEALSAVSNSSTVKAAAVQQQPCWDSTSGI